MPSPLRFPPPWTDAELDVRVIVPSTCAVDIHHPGKTMVACSLQLRVVGAAVDGLPVDKRGIFLGRLFAQLQFHGCRFTAADLEDAVRLALKGLIQKIRSLMDARRFRRPGLEGYWRGVQGLLLVRRTFSA